MPVSFENIVIGQTYDRPELADLWGYRGFQAIARGVVTPANTNLIILFVTEQKQDSLTQYNDFLDGSLLHWEGEKKHSSDLRVINASAAGDEIHLFHREIHHTPFTYKGKIELEQHVQLVSRPSQFIFTLVNELEVHEEIPKYGIKDTEKNALAKSRIGQGVFRDGLFRIWGGCAVTGYRRPVLLLASHIKPWRNSTNQERLDPYNGLLLQPTIDRLFDKGLISFDKNGKLIRASGFSGDELKTLGINVHGRLRQVQSDTMKYLEYHRNNEFEKSGA